MKKILIVDDNEDSRLLLKKALESEGWEIDLASNGKQALEKAWSSVPDMIVADILMPVMDGFQLCRAVRKEPMFDHTAFVFYTATYTDEMDKKFGLALGADAYVIKPSEPEVFIKTLKDVFDHIYLERPAPRRIFSDEEKRLLELYNQRLVNKLEKKISELEETNQFLKRVMEEKDELRSSFISVRSRMEHLLRFSPAIIYSAKPGGDFETTFVSSNVSRILGWEPKDFTETPGFWKGNIHPEDKSRVLSGLATLVDKGKHSHEYRFRHKNGAYGWLRDDLVLVRDDDGKPVEIVGSMLDITEQRRMQQQLLESENRYTELVEHMNDLICTHEMNGVLLSINKAVEKALGYTQKQMIGKNIKDVLAPQYRKDFDSYLSEIREKGCSRGYMRVVTKSGEERIWEFDNTLRDTPGGEPIVMCIARDVTERVRAEKELARSEARLKTILEASPLGVGLLKGRTIIWANQKVCEITGYSMEELLGKDARILYQTLSEYENVGQVIGSLSKRRPAAEVDTQWLRKDGAIVDCRVLYAIMDPDSANPTVVSMVEDVTERKQLEVQLRQAQKMQAIGTLAGGIAHDFNNILSAIVGYTELALMDTRPDDKIYRSLREIFRASERARDLVKQILAFSRQTEEERRPVMLGPILKEAVKLLRASIPATIEIRYELEKDLPKIFADPTQIHQVIMNLCTNAAHAMRESGGLLHIWANFVDVGFQGAGASRDLLPGRYVRLSVKDTGTGIPPEHLERIFEPYFTTKEKGVGTGLGLAVVHGIIRSYHGAVRVESEQGKGSTFHVYLPVADDDEEPAKHSEKLEVPSGSERILLVDDEPTLVDIGEQFLKKLGYQVDTSTSPLEALELFRSVPYKYDLVITDMTMPQMTGDQFAINILKIRPDIPIILTTGYSERITEPKAEALGIKKMLTKPLSLRQVAEAVRDVLDQKE